MVLLRKLSTARTCILLLSVLFLHNAAPFAFAQQQSSSSASPQQTCSADQSERDPALQEMTYDVGDGPQTTLVYVEPDVTTFYQLQDKPPAHTKVVPKFNGFQGKFINLSNKPLTLYW